MAEKPYTTVHRAGINRRALIAGGAAAGTAVALAGKAKGAAIASDADAELLELGRQWDAVDARVRAFEAYFDSLSDEVLGSAEVMGTYEDEFSSAMDDKNSLADAIFARHPATVAGAKVQAHVLSDAVMLDLYDEAPEWAMQLIADLLTIAQGGSA